jgi:transposase
VIDKRIGLIHKAQPLTTNKIITETSAMKTQLYARLLLTLNEAVSEHDKKICDRLSKHPDRHIFTSLPGAGDVLAPRLLSVFGIDRDKFNSSNDVQTFSGVAPIIIQSGQMKITSFRYACPKYIRQSFIEFAVYSTEYSMWAKAFCQRQREKGKSYQSAMRALAFRWIRIIYKCWKENKPYDELTYLKALQKRRSPLIGQLAKMR